MAIGMKEHQRTGLTGGLLFWGIVLCYSPFASLSAEELTKLPRTLRANGSETLSSIKTALEDRIQASTVAILDGDKVVALGTIVGKEGLVVTKASELGWQTSVRLPAGEEVVPESVSVNDENDIALLRLGRTLSGGLKRSVTDEISRGRFLVSPGSSRMRLKIGIVGADQRAVKRVGGALGVGLGGEGVSVGGVEVSKIFEDTAAERAGVENGDIISAVNEKVVLLREQLIEAIAAHRPGVNVVLKLRRGDENLELDVVLGYRSTYFGQLEDRNQRLSGETSTRLSGFESVLQHDIPVSVNAMGGPVVDLQGNLVGVNIAKADRVSTYAIPMRVIDQILESLGTEPVQIEGK
jgi:serine protease Do